MTILENNAVAKIHPASREILPDDPMSLTGVEISGDTDLMLRLLVEEYARIGWDLEAIMSLARNPFYTGFHGLLRHFGEERLRARVAQVLARCGVTRVKTVEARPDRDDLVTLQLPNT